MLGAAIVSRTSSEDATTTLRTPSSTNNVAQSVAVINSTPPLQTESSTPAPAAKTVAVHKSDEMQSGRLKMMEKLRAQGVFQKVEMPGNLPRLWVGSAFHSADFDTKQKFVSVVYAYYFSGVNIGDSVRIYDGKTGKEIGDYSIGNPGLKLF